MKKLIYCAAALATALFAGSCQQELLDTPAGENTVTYTVEVPGVATKAIADGKNVNRLYYEVYMTNANTAKNLSNATLLYKKDIAMVTSQEATSRANVTLNLVQNQNYTVLFWAQCDLENPVYDVTDLRNVTYKSGATVLSNHEDYAAFYSVDYISDSTPRDKKVYLQRPFAQLNIGTTINPVDYNKDPYRVALKNSKVTVKNVPTKFNVATSAVDGDAEFTFAMEEVIKNENLVVNNTEYNYVAMNYMFAGANRTATVEYWVEAEVTTQNNVPVQTNLNKSVVNVPLKENYRTNIVGNLLTSSTEYEVIVDADWAGADLAPDPIYLAAANGGEVTLTKDITLTAPLEVKAKMTINLNGKTISNPNDYAIENYSELTISGEGKMEGLGGIRSHNGKVIINGGTYTGSSDWKAGTYQHLLKAENTEVIINGGVFDATIGGITNAMINVSENSTVTINGGEFRNVNEGEVIPQFAPYMFTYEKNGKLIINGGSFYGGWRFNGETTTTDIYGGDFTVSYDGQSFHATSTHVLTIYGGTFSLANGGKLDPKKRNVAAGYKVIEKDGKFYVVPEETDAIVSGKDDLKTTLAAAVANGETNIVIDAEGAEFDMDYGLTKANVPVGTTVTIRNANVNDQSYGNAVNGTVIFENCVFNNPYGPYSIHFDAGSGDVIFKNCDLYGWNSFGSTLNSVSFENCTLNGNGKYALIRSYVALTMKNCTINISDADHADAYSEGVQAVNDATFTEENVVYVVDNIETLQTVLDNANRSTTIQFANDFEGNVTVIQKAGVKITIDGLGHKYNGFIKVHSNSNHYADAALTIKKVKFETSTVYYDSDNEPYFNFIEALENGAERYSTNITVDNCTFTATGDAINEAVALQIKSSKWAKALNCTATGLHSLLQAQSCDETVVVNGCEINGKNGVAFKQVKAATVEGTTITAAEYGIRFDGNTDNYGITVKNNNITAVQPFIVRKMTGKNNTIVLEGSNTLTSDAPYQIVITNGSDDKPYAKPTGTYTLTGAENYVIYPDKEYCDNPIKDQDSKTYEGDVFEAGYMENALWINNYIFGDGAAIVVENTTYNAIIIENCSGKFDTDVITIKNNNSSVMILQNLDFTLAEGKMLIKSVNPYYQVFMENITINGEKMTQESIAEYLENVAWYQVVEEI